VTDGPFGRSIIGLAPDEILIAEAEHGRADAFAGLDSFLAASLRQAFNQQPLVGVIAPSRRGESERVTLRDIGPEDEAFVAGRLALTRQEERGAWFLPQDAALKYGWCNLPWLMAEQPRFAINAVRDQTVRVSFREQPTALAVWSLLVPVFDDLFAPLELRSNTGKVKSIETRRKAWDEAVTNSHQLGLDVSGPLATIGYGGSWHQMTIDQQIEVKRTYVDIVRSQDPDRLARRWRARTVGILCAGYYAKAKKGSPLARTVVTARLKPLLSSTFGGSWLEFLAYLDERPNEGEQIATALPAPRLYVGGEEKVAVVAASKGLPADEVARMVGAFLGHAPGASPVGERVDVLTRWWQAYDHAHALQRPGTRSLWGLVDDGFISFDSGSEPTNGLYRELIPAEVNEEIDRLWDGVTLPRWPQRIVSEPYPHHAMADTFGPALRLWDGVALTTWYVTEGPRSRTTLDAIDQYHQAQLVELEQMGFAIDLALFADLKAAEPRLGQLEQIVDSTETLGGVTLTSYSGSRRDGFEILRDIVTAHRRAWAAQHLDNYLKYRWDTDLREVAREYSRRTAARGKAPTLKQFATIAAPAANRWFNGDIGALYAAVGEKVPARPERIDLLLRDPNGFVKGVYAALGGGPPVPRDKVWEHPEEANQQREVQKLATASLRFVQQWEALGREPTAEEFGADRFEWGHLGGPDSGWERFRSVIDAERQPQAAARRPPPPPLPPEPPRQPLIPTKAGDPVLPAPHADQPATASDRPKRRGIFKRFTRD